MNIMIIRDEFKIHGPGLHALKFGVELSKRGHKVVFCAASGELDVEIRSYGMEKFTVEGLSFSGHRILNLVRNSTRIKKIIKIERIDVVIGFNLLSTVSAYISSFLSNKINYIDIVVGEGKEKYLKFFPFKYVAISEYMMKRLMSFGISKDRLTVVYPSTIEIEQFDLCEKNRLAIRNEFDIKKEDILISSVAMFNRVTDNVSKGQDTIAKSIPTLVNQNPHIKFLFVGDGEKRKIIQESLIDYAENVRFAGKRSDVPSIMFASDIFCHFPDQETFGMVVTEAMAGKCPVVARNIGGISNIVVNEETGYLVDSVEELIKRLLDLSNDSDLRKKMGNAGRIRVEEKYTLPRVIDVLEELF